MSLPIRTTIDDIEKICSYLSTKPTGATLLEAKAVVDSKILDGRKLSAFKLWGIIEEHGSRYKLTELGRLIVKDRGVNKAQALHKIIESISPYKAIIERAVHRNEDALTANEVAAHWHEHFKESTSDSDKILNDQAVCFFQIAQGADLGQLVVGRKGQSTRFQFNNENCSKLDTETVSHFSSTIPDNDVSSDAKDDDISSVQNNNYKNNLNSSEEKNNRVFITHGKNKKILEQVKELVAYGKFEAVISQERETSAKPVPDKVMEDMRSCKAAVIHIGVEKTLYDKESNEVPQINGNVLIEIGAAMALYGRSFILLVEDGIVLPTNLQGLYECRYSGDELNMAATMKLLKGFNDFNTL